MKMNELKLVYFSPTGATRKAVMETARNIDLKSVSFDFSVYKEKKPTLKFTRSDLAIFGIPVYYGRVPALFMEYLQNISGDNTPAALVATYGCREYEDALPPPPWSLHTDAANMKTPSLNSRPKWKAAALKSSALLHSRQSTPSYRRLAREGRIKQI